MGFFQRLREGLHSIRVRLSAIVSRKDVPKDVREDVARLDRKVERMEKDARPQERSVAERFSPEDRPKRFNVSIQYRPVQSSRAYREYKWSGFADSLEDAIALAEEELEDEPDYYLSIESKRDESE